MMLFAYQGCFYKPAACKLLELTDLLLFGRCLIGGNNGFAVDGTEEQATDNAAGAVER